MAENKKSFVLYCDLIGPVSGLSDTDAGALIKSILYYVNGQRVKIHDNLNPIYLSIVKNIEAEWSKFNPVTGKYHWNYKGGITPVNKTIRNSAESDLWRIKVFERDRYTCQKCGKAGGTLNAHHIKEFSKYPELRFEVSNGLTLCKTCHVLIHKKKIQCRTEC